MKVALLLSHTCGKIYQFRRRLALNRDWRLSPYLMRYIMLLTHEDIIHFDVHPQFRLILKSESPLFANGKPS